MLQVWQMTAWIWVLAHLLLLSAEDLKEHQISMPVILELGGTGFLYGMFTGHVPQLIPGCLLLFLGRVSREQIGYGDGWLFLALGMWLDLPELLWILFWGMGSGTLTALFLRKKELPLVPFLTMAYVIGVWL